MINIQSINDQAKVYFDNKQFDKALELLDRHDLPKELRGNLAKCYYYMNQADKALEIMLSLNKDENGWIDTALYYNAIGNHQKAFEIYKTLDQTNPKVQFNIGWHYLRNNEFVKGFQHIQHGDKVRAWGHEYIHLENGVLNKENRWDGSYTHHLVYILEGGLGDEMIFLRWADYCKTKCDQLTIVCNQSLLRLLTNAGYDCVPHQLLASINYTAYCPAMSVAAICEFENPQHHITFPYIKSFTERYITKQIDQIAGNKLKIGIKFWGNQEFEHDQFRTPPTDKMKQLSKYGQLFSLQFDDNNSTIPNCKHIINDWTDAMERLDYEISKI